MLTNSKRPPNTVAPGSGDSEQDKILKGLLDASEEKEHMNAFGGGKMNAPNQASQQQRLGQQGRPGSVGIDTKNDNPMLMHLLNHDDDNVDGRSNQRNCKSSELLRQLQKEDTPKDHHHNANPMNNEEQLFQILRFQGNDFTSRKRSSNDSDDSPLAKRTEEKPSKLREKNKMLASLLSNPSKAPTTFTTIPVVKTIPDIPQSRIANAQSGFQVSFFLLLFAEFQTCAEYRMHFLKIVFTSSIATTTKYNETDTTAADEYATATAAVESKNIGTTAAAK